jgi:tagatose-1,6-bisphosphate aldolase non-catalytic subunit AgaZ/GatZ
MRTAVISPLLGTVRRHKAGEAADVSSVCSAHPPVLDRAGEELGAYALACTPTGWEDHP